MAEKNETLGRRIARLRLEHGMTQERLARELGVTAQAVSKWENDLSAPDIMLLPELARTLGVTVDALLGAGEPVSGASEGAAAEAVAEPEPVSEEPPVRAHRLHIQVHDADDGDNVNINVPLGLASAVLRTGVGVNVFDNDVDTRLLADAISRGEPGTLVEVNSPDGDHVTISLE